MTPGPSRRRVLLAGAGVLGAGAALGGRRWHTAGHARAPLASSTVVLTADDAVVPVPGPEVPPGASIAPGSRVLTDPARPGAAAGALAREREWLAAGHVPGSTGPFAALARDALLDLRVLLRPGGALIAGWPAAWRYVWPRDASFGAVALAATGHGEDALAVLDFLDRVQEPDGTFQARYLMDGSGPPDDRGTQLDGTGWTVWAVDGVVARLPPERRGAALDRFHPLVTRSVTAIEGLVATTGLPPVSADYWEVEEDRLTLGTVAPLVAGLAAAAAFGRRAGDVPLHRRAAGAARRLDDATTAAFGPGYPRHRGGDDPDAAVTFTLPPIGTGGDPRRRDALREASRRMRRPAGGLAPGAGWRNDGISWTPETALVALAEAYSGDAPSARRRLHWLDRHKTVHGSLPEKVLHDGSPAGPAPLSWTAALVLLVLEQLDRLEPAAARASS